MKPSRPRPASILAQVEASGTAVTVTAELFNTLPVNSPETISFQLSENRRALAQR